MVHVDLNLLVALDTLLEEESVGAAAARLGLSQPAMSRTLGRLRRALGDEVLVRSGRLMLPTPYADSVRAEVHELVQRGTGVLSGAGELDLRRLRRTFTLRCHDALTDLVAAPLLAAARRAAPEVRLRFLAEAAGGVDGLRTAETDLEIGSDVTAASETRTRRVGSSPLVVVSAAGDLLPPTTTAADYAASVHITVSRRGRLSDPIDDLLAEQGLARRVVATVPTTRIALDIVGAGGAVTTVPAAAFRAAAHDGRLDSRPLPLPAEPVDVAMRWHRRHDADAAHAWLRDAVEGALRRGLDPS